MLNLTDWSLVIRDVSVASSPENALVNLFSHLTYGALSLREMQDQKINPRYSMEGTIQMYTPENEISVDTLWKFRFLKNLLGNDSLWLFLPTSITQKSSSHHIHQVDHPVIYDTTLIEDRKILGIYSSSPEYIWDVKKMLVTLWISLAIYWSNFEEIKDL